MTKKEITELRAVFNQELIKYSDTFYENCVKYATDENYFVELTLEMLEFLDLHFENYGVDFVKDYSEIIGETVYFSFYGFELFPVDDKLRKQISEDEDPSDGLVFYSFNDIEDLVINSISNNRGFTGIIDSFTHVTYDNLNDLFIYSMLKYKNKK
jgi:hypothetical protein